METMKRADFDGLNVKERAEFVRGNKIVDNTEAATITAERYRELHSKAGPPVQRSVFDRLSPEARKAHIDTGGVVFD